MATSFEEYVQLELPKRPYLENDVPVESIIIRRGEGTRQLDGLELGDGDILIKRNGSLVAEPISSSVSAIQSLVHVQNTPALQWSINHDKANSNVVITILDTNKHEILADTVSVGDNSITIDFSVAQAGLANVIFLPD